VSGGFHSTQDAEVFYQITGYYSAAYKNGLNILEIIRRAFVVKPDLLAFVSMAAWLAA
jgi:hypothetical protein